MTGRMTSRTRRRLSWLATAASALAILYALTLTPAQVNALTGPPLILIIVMLTAAMGLRLVNHIRAGRKAPLLLIRDLLLYLALLVLIAGSQFSRITGVRLGEQTWWVLGTNVLNLAAVGMWLAVEVAIVGRHRMVPPPVLVCPHCGIAIPDHTQEAS